MRITHIPTGVVVTCQDEKSQHKNKARAMKVLASRILQAEREKQHSEQAADRKSQVGSGDRSERIRTYNFPQGRVTDHRVNLTLYSLDRFMDGDIEGMIDALAAQAQAEALRAEARGRGTLTADKFGELRSRNTVLPWRRRFCVVETQGAARA